MSCATVPTALSESAWAPLRRIESSAATNASPSHRAAKPQISVIENLRSAFFEHDTEATGTDTVPTLSSVSRRHHQPCGGCGGDAIPPNAYLMIPERRRVPKPPRAPLSGKLFCARLWWRPPPPRLLLRGPRPCP